jgi:hypothetical protein
MVKQPAQVGVSTAALRSDAAANYERILIATIAEPDVIRRVGVS